MLEIVGLLSVFALVILLCYYTTKFVGKKFSGRTINKTMKIIETLPLGLDRSLYLILVGKKTFLFLSSKKGLELVSELDIEELPEGAFQEKSESTSNFDFKRIFETYSGLSQKPPLKHTEKKGGESEETQADGIDGSHSINGSSHVVGSDRSHSINGSSHVVGSDRSHSILGSIRRLQKINGSEK